MFQLSGRKPITISLMGPTNLVPLVHAQSDMWLFPILGKIISHGYLASGYLPVRISLPSLVAMLLAPIPRSFLLLKALMDYISDSERDRQVKECFEVQRCCFVSHTWNEEWRVINTFSTWLSGNAYTSNSSWNYSECRKVWILFETSSCH